MSVMAMLSFFFTNIELYCIIYIALNKLRSLPCIFDASDKCDDCDNFEVSSTRERMSLCFVVVRKILAAAQYVSKAIYATCVCCLAEKLHFHCA